MTKSKTPKPSLDKHIPSNIPSINDLSTEEPGSATWLLLHHLERPSQSSSEGFGLQLPLSFRLDAPNYFAVESMARISNRSKNYVANLLFSAGIAWIVDHLSDQGKEDYDDMYQKVMHEILSKSPDYKKFIDDSINSVKETK